MRTPPRKTPETGIYGPIRKELNELRDYCREIAISGGRGIKANRTANGTFLVAEIPPTKPSQPGVVKQFRVESVENDYLVCYEFDGSNTTGSVVNVAKPFNLRRTPWHGRTITYTIEPYPGAPASIQVSYSFPNASVPTYRRCNMVIGAVSTTEHQVVRPFWVPSVSVIFASGSENGTGVSGATEWQDLNVDGRAWADALS